MRIQYTYDYNRDNKLFVHQFCGIVFVRQSHQKVYIIIIIIRNAQNNRNIMYYNRR